MNDLEVAEYLPVYADGELEPELAQALEVRLTGSPELRAQLARWQALRGAAHRAIAAERLPRGLEARLRAQLRAQPNPARYQRLRRYVPLAAAAMVVITVVASWLMKPPATGPGTPVLAGSLSPTQFARIYRHCALADPPHDEFLNCEHTPGALARELATKLGFGVTLPDLGARGYTLVGACTCFPGKDLRVAHAIYRAADGTRTVVSFFLIERALPLADCTHPSCARRLQRSYSEAADQDVSVVKWDQGGMSYALCSLLPPDQLYALAETVSLARVLHQQVEQAYALRP